MNHSIPLARAISMTGLYRNQHEAILKESERGKNLLPLCETFDAASVQALLLQPGCARFRIYYGMDTEQKVHAILVGVDSNDADILLSATANVGAGLNDEAIILDEAFRCPTICPPPSPLNT